MSRTQPLAITPSADVPARGSYVVDPERSRIGFTATHALAWARFPAASGSEPGNW